MSARSSSTDVRLWLRDTHALVWKSCFQIRSIHQQKLGITQQQEEKVHLAELHVAWLPVTKLPPLPPIPVTGHKVQAGADVL